jgi:hypothetical protein
MGRDAARAGRLGLSRPGRPLVAAYRAARYEVRIGPRTIRLRVGHAVPQAVAGWLGASPGAVFITACAPLGRRHLRASQERAAMRRLVRAARRSGARHAPGEGGDDAGDWGVEPSLLLALPDPREAARWGRAWRQNAVLWVPRRGRVRLVLLR